MTRVMGLDLALGATGVARVDGTFTTLKPPGGKKGVAGYGRHHWLREAILDLLAEDRPDVVVVEDYAPRSIGIKSTIAAGELQGIVRTSLHVQGHPWVAIKPNVLKKYATGNGNAKKEQMADAAEADLIRGAPRPSNFDEADAYWLRMMGAHHYDLGGLGTGTLSQPHRIEALEAVVWPELDQGGTP